MGRAVGGVEFTTGEAESDIVGEGSGALETRPAVPRAILVEACERRGDVVSCGEW